MVGKGKNKRGTFGGNYDTTSELSEEMGKIPLLDKFLCIGCEKFKSPHMYSNKQLNSYRFKAFSSKTRITPITAGLKCRLCVGEQVTELHCNGPCDSHKSLSEFSKNQRTSPETAWCTTCTQWREACEPEVTVQAHPNGVLSTDEEPEVGGLSIGFLDIEGGASDDEFGGYDSMAAMSINARQGQTDKATATFSNQPDNISSAGNTTSSLSNPYDTPSANSGEIEENQKPETSRSGLSTGQTSGTGWSVVDARRNPHKVGVSYNAYDPTGNLYERVRMPSTSASTTSAPSNMSRHEGTPKASTAGNGWGRTPTRKTPIPQFPATSRPQGRRTVYDDDESADEA